MESLIPFYEEHFGPCPNDKLTISMGYSLGKNTAAIAAPNYLIFSGGISTNYILYHEFAHQWFGNAINADETYESWLNESFAQYAARLYMINRPNWKEKITAKKSKTGILDLWPDLKAMNFDALHWMVSDLFGDQLLLPIYEEGIAMNWEDLDDLTSLLSNTLTVYAVGSNSLFMLRASTGDSLMKEIMHEYHARYERQAPTTTDFINVIKDLAGENVADNFFAALTLNRRPDPGIADVVSTKIDNKLWQTTVKTKTSSLWQLPVNFQAVTSSGDTLQFQRQWLNNSNNLEFNSVDKIVSIAMAPEGQYFDYNRYNNNWPRQFKIQPIYGLPSWDSYKVYIQPMLKEDWQGEWRYGVRFQGTLGINLMPIIPSYFKNSFGLAIDYAHNRTNKKVGFKFIFKTPLADNPLYQIGLMISDAYPRNAQHISLLTYLEKPKYYFDGGISQYMQLILKLGRTEYSEAAASDWWEQGKYFWSEIEFKIFYHSLEHRALLHYAYLLGQDIGQNANQSFSRQVIEGQYGRPIFNKVTTDVWIENRMVIDYRSASDLRTRFGYSILPFVNTHGVSRFRGFTNNTDQRWKNTLAGGISIGIGKYTRFKPKPILYFDVAFAGQNYNDLFIDQSPTYRAAGLGFEGNSIARYGIYLPLWISHPSRGKQNFKFRILAQLELNW
jgi:hypothetical protein